MHFFNLILPIFTEKTVQFRHSSKCIIVNGINVNWLKNVWYHFHQRANFRSHHRSILIIKFVYFLLFTDFNIFDITMDSSLNFRQLTSEKIEVKIRRFFPSPDLWRNLRVYYTTFLQQHYTNRCSNSYFLAVLLFQANSDANSDVICIEWYVIIRCVYRCHWICTWIIYCFLLRP